MTSEIPAGGLDFHVPNGAEFVSVAFSPDGSHLAAGSVSAYGPAYVWDIATGTLTTLADPGNPGVTAVAFSPDGKFLAVSDWNGSIYVRALSQLGA